jgi:hypothetical protein
MNKVVFMSDIYEAEKTSVVKLDLQDRKLLFALDFDARATLSSLAKRVRMSKQGVDYKIKNLTRQEYKGILSCCECTPTRLYLLQNPPNVPEQDN